MTNTTNSTTLEDILDEIGHTRRVICGDCERGWECGYCTLPPGYYEDEDQEGEGTYYGE